MIKMKLFVLCVLIFFVTDLSADSIFAGNPGTVDAESGFNALKNPALMSMQAGNSTAFVYNQSMTVNSETRGEIDFDDVNITEETLDVDYSDKYKGNLTLSHVARTGRTSFGMGLNGGDDGQFVLKESNITIEGESTGIPFTITGDEDEKGFSLGPVVSWSYRFSRNESVGIQLEGTVLRTESTNNGYDTSSLEYTVKDKELRRYTGSITLGYHMKGDKFDIGMVLRTGEYGYESSELDYENKTILTDEHEEVDLYFIKNKGMEISLGFLFRPGPRLKLMIEGGAAMPYIHKQKEISDDSPFDVEKSESRAGLNYVFKAGLDYHLTAGLNVGLGGAYYRFKSKTYSSDIPAGRNALRGYEFIMGFDYNIGDGLNLLIGTGIFYGKSEYETINSPTVFDIRAESYSSSFTAGLARYY